jgi:hypothetical protein
MNLHKQLTEGMKQALLSSRFSQLVARRRLRDPMSAVADLRSGAPRRPRARWKNLKVDAAADSCRKRGEGCRARVQSKGYNVKPTNQIWGRGLSD